MAKVKELAMRPKGMSLAQWRKHQARVVSTMRRKLGLSWRLLCQGNREREYFAVSSKEAPVEFDELCVDDWFHIERMDTRCWWMRVGECDFWITIPRKGEPRVTLTEGALFDPSKKRGKP